MNRNFEVKDKFVEAVFANDKDTVASYIHPDFVLRQANGLEYAGTYYGADGFFKFMEKYDPAYEPEGLELINTFTSEDPDVLVLEFHSKGLRRSTGNRFDTSVLEVWTFRDGKVLGIAPHWFEQPQ